MSNQKEMSVNKKICVASMVFMISVFMVQNFASAQSCCAMGGKKSKAQDQALKTAEQKVATETGANASAPAGASVAPKVS